MVTRKSKPQTAAVPADAGLLFKEAAIGTSINAIAMAGMDGRLFYVNESFVRLWKLADEEQALGRLADQFWERPEEARQVMEALGSCGQWQGELRARCADDSTADLQLSAHLVTTSQGQPVGMMASFVDITAKKQTALALQQERDFAASLVATAPVIILLLDTRGSILHVNPYFEQLTGYRLEEVRGKDWFATFLPERERERIRALFRNASHDQPTRGNCNLIVTRSGEERMIEWNDQVMRDPDGSIRALLATGLDVTQRVAMGRALEQSEYLYRMLTQLAPVGIFHTDRLGRCTYVNDQWCEITGRRRDDALQTSWLESVDSQDQERIQQEWTLATLRRRPFSSEFRFDHGDGQTVWVMARAQPQANEAGQQDDGGYIGTVTDITERKLSEAEIRWLAFYDPLTNLPNRRLLLDRLQQALAVSARSGRRGALMYVDLDTFKNLNDTHGHEKGDLLLFQVAQRLLGCVREGDTVARLGGDEFVVMLEGLDPQARLAAQQATGVAEKILAACRQPYRLAELEYSSTLSIGATLFKGHARSIEELMHAADQAMYQAKAGGRSTLRLIECPSQRSSEP